MQVTAYEAGIRHSKVPVVLLGVMIPYLKVSKQEHVAEDTLGTPRGHLTVPHATSSGHAPTGILLQQEHGGLEQDKGLPRSQGAAQ